MYNNFEIYNPIVTLDMLVWSVFAGLSIGCVGSFLNGRIVGGFVRHLLKEGINTPEKALSLSDLGQGKNLYLRYTLRPDGPLRRTVSRIGDDVKTAKFYIPEEMRIAAEVRWEAKDGSLMKLILSLLLLIAMGFAALYLIPELLTLTDNFLGSI